MTLTHEVKTIMDSGEQAVIRFATAEEPTAIATIAAYPRVILFVILGLAALVLVRCVL